MAKILSLKIAKDLLKELTRSIDFPKTVQEIYEL